MCYSLNMSESANKFGRKILFDTSNSYFPVAPPNHRLSQIKFTTCPGTDLALVLTKLNIKEFDEFGLSKDSWWSIRCSNLPNRDLRLFRGTHSMKHLLQRYGFMDSSGCVNHKRAQAIYEPITTHFIDKEPDVPLHLLNAIGVPQFYERSGVCWFAALCTTAFSDLTIKRFIQGFMPGELSKLCNDCLLKRQDAESFRDALWTDYGIGDDINDRPENDGCNGFSEFTLLCAKLSIPLVRYKEEGGKFKSMPCDLRDKRNVRVRIHHPPLTKPHFLVLRFQDGDHVRFPLLRRITVKGVRYRWVGCFAGQRKCGHQIGIASTNGNWRNLIIGDADVHKDGIGPVFINYRGSKWSEKKEWWGALEYVVHVTKFGSDSQFCNLSLHNPPDDSLDKYRGKRVGKNSVDMLYFTDVDDLNGATHSRP
jgi:hypothetical protein